MTNSETEKEIDYIARHRADSKLDEQRRQYNNPLQRAVDTATLKHLKLTETEVLKMQQEIDEKFWQTEYEAEAQRKRDTIKSVAECNDVSFRIFFKMFTPASQDGSEALPNGWKHRLTCPIFGTKSPTLEEIVREQAFAIPDFPTALNDPNAYILRLSEVFSDKPWSYILRCSEPNSDEYREHKSCEFFWQTKQTKFPHKIPKP